MARATVERIAEHTGTEVTILGWLAAKRSSGKIHFLQVRDGTGTIQCVMVKNQSVPEEFEAADRCTQESSVAVTGTVREDARSPIGFEIDVKSFAVVSASEPYPISPKDHGTAFLMENRHLWLRSRRQHAILRVRASIVRAIRDYFDDHGFLLVDTPILTPAACEGTTTLFELDYFGEKAYLTQSGQLYNEATAAAFGKVYAFGPTFRAEKSKTRRHLTEFWMVEPEMAFAHLDDVMVLGERLTKFIIQRVLEGRREELEILERDLAPLQTTLDSVFDRMTYSEAVAKLKALGSDIEWGQDFGNDDETILMNATDRPLWVHHFPRAFKAFYMEPDPEDPLLALGADLLAPEGYGEVIGGGERASSLQYLLDQIAHEGLNQADYEWYLDVRRFGGVPHAGFGLGLERAVAWICKLPHVRETAPYPRMMGTLRP